MLPEASFRPEGRSGSAFECQYFSFLLITQTVIVTEQESYLEHLIEDIQVKVAMCQVPDSMQLRHELGQKAKSDEVHPDHRRHQPQQKEDRNHLTREHDAQ